MKKIIFLTLLIPFFLQAQVSGDVTITIVGGTAVQDTLDLKKDKTDSSNATSGYTTLFQNAKKVAIGDSATMPGYASLTNLATKVAKSDSGTMPGYSTLTNLATKVAKADSATMPGYVSLTNHTTKVSKADSATFVTRFKTYTGNGATAVDSGALYDYLIKK